MSFSDSTTMSPTAPPAYFREVVVAGSCWYGKVSVCRHGSQTQKKLLQDEDTCHCTGRKPKQGSKLPQSPDAAVLQQYSLFPTEFASLPQPMHKDTRVPVLF